MTALVFDRCLLRARRERAAANFAAHDFLKVEVAQRLLERFDLLRPRPARIVDLGCHNGGLGRLLAARAIVPAAQGDLAFNLVRRALGARLVLDEEYLPFAPSSLDGVVSALSLHWVNDLPGCLRQIQMALAPGGLFLASLFGQGTLRELRRALIEAETEILGGAAPRVSPFLDAETGAALLQRAGFAQPVSERETIEVSYPDGWTLLRDLRGMGESNVLLERSRKPLRRDVLALALARYEQEAKRADGRIPASFEIVSLSGWRDAPAVTT